ncbi:unnamed protein product [Rotaria magnacalcarata]|uniref:Uncharacterized protein n=1 Tax=Rotaria magnacalcarata TaxID=392030 RepID=A0A820BVB4_9BILA|nr:unnamed protein product [Rotaria magnacalcarata]
MLESDIETIELFSPRNKSTSCVTIEINTMDANATYSYLITPRKSENPVQTVPKQSSDSHFNQISRLNSSNSQPNTYIGQPPFKPLDISQSIRSNAARNNEINKTKNTNSEFNCNKILRKVTSSKMIFFMVGFILCAIPLAVFVTLCVCLNMGANAFSTCFTLPIECYSYTTLTESYRNYQTFSGCCWTPYDTVSSLPSGWYRISGSAGTALLTTPIYSMNICGASYGGYFNGTLPTTTGGSATGTFCFYTGSPCSYPVAPITAINCNGYYVFYLISPSTGSSYRYCSTN